MNKWTSSSEFEENVRQSFAVPAPRSEFVDQVYGDLMRRADQKSYSPRRFLGLRPAWTATLAILSVLIIGTLAIGPQHVYAEFMRLFSYVPGVGFVNPDQVRVLENGVTQQHDDRELTAQRGLITEYSTDLWLEFSDEARPIDEAWLETTDGLRFELQNWNYSPDEAGSHGVVAHFPPLPAEVNQVTLALTEGWRIPLTWVPGSKGNLTPANIIPAPSFAAGEGSNSTPAIDATAAPASCAEAMDIQFCVQAATRTETDMQVLIEAVSSGQFTSGSNYNLSMFDVPGEMENLTLSDAEGNVYPINDYFIPAQGEPVGRMSTLSFPGAQELKGRLSLNISTILVSIPLSEELTIDLGDNPAAGQTLPLDQTIDVGGFPVHFSEAVLEGEGETSLRVKIISDSLDDSAPIRPAMLEPGRPEGIDDLYGAGNTPDNLYIHVELMQQSGLKTGILRIPLVSGSLKVRGPFTLAFDAPGEPLALTATPQVIEGGSFEPEGNGEPLPMEAYQYTGRALLSGDLLSIVLGEDQTTLYAASSESGFTPEKLVVLPGQVLAVYPHSDRQGMDYVTGEYDQETNALVYRQLYTLRFGDPSPRLLIGRFEHSATDFSWSYDGAYLAYLTVNEQPGQPYQRFVNLVDMSCRTSGECTAFTADTGKQDLYGIKWSPVDYRISFGGAASEVQYGTGDIFLLNFNPADGSTSLTNLTASTTIEDMAAANWTSGGDALFYTCDAGLNEINEYSLCRNDLTEGEDEVVVPLLPWNMQSPQFGADRWLVDSLPVMQNGVFSLRAYDLQNGQSSTLLEWSLIEKHSFIETSISPDGQWVAANINELGGLLALNIESHQSKLVMPIENNLFLVTWVK